MPSGIYSGRPESILDIRKGCPSDTSGLSTGKNLGICTGPIRSGTRVLALPIRECTGT